MTPLSIKVCGMTEAENIREVEQLGVDMIGFIFYPKSPRCLCELPDYLPVHAKRVGVFVNENKENIQMYAHRFALDYIQLHGDESPEYCIDIFGTDGKTDGVWFDSLIQQFFLGALAVCSGCRMDNQRFYVGNVSQQGEQLQIVDKIFCFLCVTFDLKCEDRSSAIWEIFLI